MDSAFNKPLKIVREYRLDLEGSGVMVVLFCIMNEPVMLMQVKLFTSNYSNQLFHKVSFIYIITDLYFWSCS